MPELFWSNEKRKVGDLIPWERNPRILTKDQREQLTKSLSRFGIVEPVAINRDNLIIGGHQRTKVLALMREYGDDAEIDVRVPNRLLSDREVEELNIRLNKNTGGFDYGKLQTEFELPDLEEWGFKPYELGLPAEELDYDEVWGDMPEFQETPAEEVRREGGQLIVHFRTMADRADFAEVIGQKLTPTTRFVWHPKREYRVAQDWAFVDEGDVVVED